MSGRFFYLFWFLPFFLEGLYAEPVITITPPGLVSEFASLQEVLNENAQLYRDDLAEIVVESLDKPGFMDGFNGAAGVALSVPSAGMDGDVLFVNLGSSASVFAEGLSPSLADELAGLDPESDMVAGMCVQPVVATVGVPLGFLIPGLYAGASAGYIDADAGEYGMKAVNAGGFVGFRFFRPRGGLVSWEGINAQAGGDWLSNRLSATVRPGTISQEVPLDPDGDGPLVPQTVTLVVDPVVRAGIETALISFRGSVSTGITLLGSLTLRAGGTVAWASGRSGITVDSNDEVRVEGSLGDLVDPERPGSVSITGTATEFSSERWFWFLDTALIFRVGSFSIGVPLIWQPGAALGTGAFFGITL